MLSGGAMSLFLNDQLVHKIMIFGHWSSNAFLVYVRPQVLGWTNQMSKDMIEFDSFLNASDTELTSTTPKRIARSMAPQSWPHDFTYSTISSSFSPCCHCLHSQNPRAQWQGIHSPGIGFWISPKLCLEQPKTHA
jgi:hypothetical protein